MDGQLSPADRARVERALVTNPGAQEQVRLQGEINASLERLFGPAPARALSFPAPRRRLLWPLAAAIIMAGAGIWAAFFRTAPAAGSGPLAAIYHAQVDAGFIPKEVCTTRDEFARWVQTYYTQPLYPAAVHDGVEFVGWSYAPAIGKNSGVLLAKVRGREVIVVLDRKVLERQQFTVAGDPSLHLFRKQFGAIVLYEVSPFDQAAILPILSSAP